MEKESVPDNEKLQHDDMSTDEHVLSDEHTKKDDATSEKDVKGSDLNKSKKGHITNLNEEIVKTERRIEDLNKSIMGQDVFDF